MDVFRIEVTVKSDLERRKERRKEGRRKEGKRERRKEGKKERRRRDGAPPGQEGAWPWMTVLASGRSSSRGAGYTRIPTV
jgi:hypothetical protein